MSVSCRILNLPAVLKEKEVAFAATPSVGMAAASDALHTGWLTSEVKPAKADPWMNCRLLMFMMSIFSDKGNESYRQSQSSFILLQENRMQQVS